MNKRPTLTLGNFKKKTLDDSGETGDQEKAGAAELKDAPEQNTKADASSSRTLGSAAAAGRAKPDNQVNGPKHLISNEDYKPILKYLQKNYPKCFPNQHDGPAPLAVGIHRQLLAIPDFPFPKMQMRKFLKRYVRHKSYRSRLIVGHDRVNLDGAAASKVLAAEIDRSEWKKIKAARFKTVAIHDLLIKKALENPAMAQEFLELYLPQEYKDMLDLGTVTPQKETYVEDSLKAKLSDMVFSVQLKTDKTNLQAEEEKSGGNERLVNHEEQSPAFIYCLMEHQSSSDYWIALRLLKYSLLLLERHATGRNKLPLILPLVLYNGKKGYSAPGNIFELFSHPETARKIMTEDYQLIDLQSMSDDDINYEKHLSFLLYVMKHIHDRDMLLMLKTAMERCNKAIVIDQKQNYVLTRLILWYTDSRVAIEKKQELEQLITDNLPPKDTENIMKTIAQSYIEEGFNIGIQEGEARGIEKGMERAALNMLAQNLTPELIAQYTGLSVKQITALRDSVGRKEKTLH